MDFKNSMAVQWVKNDEDSSDESMESSLSSISDSLGSCSSTTSSLDLGDDASSSVDSCTRSENLRELVQLMDQLSNTKRGLSKFYHGKSQTFASLENVRTLEDLEKKEDSHSRRMKSCKSYATNLNHHKFGPKPTIAKRSSPERRFSPPLGAKLSAIVID